MATPESLRTGGTSTDFSLVLQTSTTAAAMASSEEVWVAVTGLGINKVLKAHPTASLHDVAIAVADATGLDMTATEIDLFVNGVLQSQQLLVGETKLDEHAVLRAEIASNSDLAVPELQVWRRQPTLPPHDSEAAKRFRRQELQTPTRPVTRLTLTHLEPLFHAFPSAQAGPLPRLKPKETDATFDIAWPFKHEVNGLLTLTPPNLLARATEFIKSRSLDRPSTSNEVRFEQAHESRRAWCQEQVETRRTPSNWSNPVADDLCWGIVEPVASADKIYEVDEVRVAVQTTFPVGASDGSIWSHRASRQTDPRLAHTAIRLSWIQRQLLPQIGHRWLWLDTNPCPRPAPDKTRRSALFEQLFAKTAEMTTALNVDVLWVQQATNHELVIVNLAPTHVDTRFDKTSPDRWHWRPDAVGVPVIGDDNEEDDLRPISAGERLYWWQHHVVESSRLLPFAPKSLFVKGHAGCSDRLLIFSSHLCVLDQMRYQPERFEDALDDVSRAVVAIASLYEPSKRVDNLMDNLTIELLNGLPGLSSLRYEFGVRGHADELFLNFAQRDGILQGFRAIRRLEFQRAASQDHRLGPLVWEIASLYIAPTLDLLAINYVPAQFDRRGAVIYLPSIARDVLASLAVSSVHGLAKMEAAKEAGTATQLELRRFEFCRTDAKWRERLVEKYGLSLRTLTKHSGKTVYPIANSHFAPDAACGVCASSPWKKCVVPYVDAVEQGWAREQSSRLEAMSALSAWIYWSPIKSKAPSDQVQHHVNKLKALYDKLDRNEADLEEAEDAEDANFRLLDDDSDALAWW
ncbi:hypothetical protein ACM66B_006404 [Microbotryomycetes sp. NB124-2]